MAATLRVRPHSRHVAKRTAVAVYLVVSAVFVRELAVGSRSRIVLLLVPVALFAIDRYPRAALVGLMPLFLLDIPLTGGTAQVRLPLAVLVVWAAGLLTRRWHLVPHFHIALAALAALLLLSLELSPHLYSPFSRSEDLLTLSLGLGVCGVAASIRPKVQVVLAAIGASGLLTAVVILTGLFGAVDHSSGAQLSVGPDRVSALGLNPNYLGVILAMGAIALLGVAIERRQPLLGITAVPIMAALPAIKSRGAFVILAVGLFVLVFVGRGFRTRTLSIASVALLLLLAPNVLSQTYDAALGARSRLDLSQSDSARRVAAKLAFDEGLRNPAFGIGYGNFPDSAQSTPDLGIFINTHNDYLRIFAEAGFPAAICLVGILIVAIKRARRLPSVPALAVLLAYSVGLLSANTLSNLPVTVGVWVLLGTVAARGVRPTQGTTSPTAGMVAA